MTLATGLHDILILEASEAGCCDVGIESTVVKLDEQSQQLVLLRRGGIPESVLASWMQDHGGPFELVIKAPSSSGSSASKAAAVTTAAPAVSAPTASPSPSAHEEEIAQEAPGMLLTHYAPDVPSYLLRFAAAPAVVCEAAVAGAGEAPCELKHAAVLDFGGAPCSAATRTRHALQAATRARMLDGFSIAPLLMYPNALPLLACWPSFASHAQDARRSSLPSRWPTATSRTSQMQQPQLLAFSSFCAGQRKSRPLALDMCCFRTYLVATLQARRVVMTSTCLHSRIGFTALLLGAVPAWSRMDSLWLMPNESCKPMVAEQRGSV
mmetsp:Transcript_9278/g.20325  ORF Transcript_9278/g.20325 Transcript_9278/m.20325 type:complete len:324 (+) Transcript_9278:965-1936(+)